MEIFTEQMKDPSANGFKFTALVLVHSHTLTDAMFMAHDCRHMFRGAAEVTPRAHRAALHTMACTLTYFSAKHHAS